MQVYLVALAVSLLFGYLYMQYQNGNAKRVEINTSAYIKPKTQYGIRLTGFFFAFMSAVPLSFVAAIREGVGTDYYSAYAYSYYYHLFYNSGYFKREFFYNLKEEFLSRIDAKTIWIFVFTAAITGAVYYYTFVKYSVNLEYSILLYFITNIYFISLNAIRQGVAMAILILAVQYLIKNENKKFVILIIVATGFHTSCIIFLALYFLTKIDTTPTRTFIFLGLSILGGAVIGRVVKILVGMTVYAGYYGSLFDEDSFDIFNAAIQLAVLLYYAFYLEKAKRSEYGAAFRVYFWMQVVAVFFISQSANIPLAKRLCWYMTVNQPLALPIVSKLEESLWVKMLFNVLIIVGFSASIYVGIVKNGAHQVLPYNSIFGPLL